MGLNPDGVPFVISSIYNSLVFQTTYEGKNYILCSGIWYQVETAFYEQVNNYISTVVKISGIILPECEAKMKEGEYNKRTADSNPDYCLCDRKMVSVAGGPKRIESCDILTRNKQFIHVKNKAQSSQLSHLFAQGRISAECFISDEEYRKQVSLIAEKKFGIPFFDYTKKPGSNEYEVVYAIIDDKDSDLVHKLPFFSKVNLMLTTQELDRMHFKSSVCLVKRKTNS